MNIFFTSDPHFGHKNVIEHCDRPFGSVQEMNETMIANWNSVVSADDFTWILGDYDINGDEKNLAYLSRMNGRKGLISGNHDKCWVGKPIGHKHIARYVSAGFEFVTPWAQLKIVDKNGVPNRVMMSHFPYQGDGDGRPDRYVECRLPDTGRWLLCGHIHNRWTQRDRQINVGVDVRNFTPVSLQEIAAIIAEGKQDR